ncbi:MAG TPA: ATP-binding protein [Nitrospira sp.]|nr:ATP-binding protein [Nitrospira sp.]
MSSSHFNPYEILKAATLILLAVLLFSLGSATRATSIGAYLSFSAIMVLQGLEIFAPAFSDRTNHIFRRTLFLRISIVLQLLLASMLVAVTDGSGSVYELVYLLPIISAATKLPGVDVIVAVAAAAIAMVGFIVTGGPLTPSITHVKEFQDAVAAIVYFTMAGLLIYFFSKGEREQREQYQALAGMLSDKNHELRGAQDQLTERLTQVTKMEEQLQQISRMAILGEMAGQIAHEIRNPLGIITGSVDILARRTSDPGIRNHISVLRQETARLNKAVEGVLRLGRPLQLRREAVDLSHVLVSVVQLAAAWSLPQVKIRLQPSLSILVVNGDHDLLHQAFGNLIKNAGQAMPAGGVVTISQSSKDGGQTAEVVISDRGVGIAGEDLKRLGDPFFSERQGGIGLGFSLARRVVLEHGGALKVTSKVGQGTIVTVTLPLFKHSGEPEYAIHVKSESAE